MSFLSKIYASGAIRYHVTANKEQVKKHGFRSQQKGGIGGNRASGDGNIYVWNTVKTAENLKDMLNYLEGIRTTSDPILFAIKNRISSNPFGTPVTMQSMDEAKKLLNRKLGKCTDRQVALFSASYYVPYSSFDFDGEKRNFEVVRVDVSQAKLLRQKDDEEVYFPDGLVVL